MADVKGTGAYNVVVIGGGTAGLVAAAGTAGLGGRVALVERGRLGGDCLNTGCVPSKALVASARLVRRVRRADRLGLDLPPPRVRFEKVFDSMREVRARIAPHDSAERLESLGVDVFSGVARFVSPREVVVGDTRLTAKNFVVATGSRPSIPPVAGLDTVRFFTTETIFDELDRKPAQLVILGAGPTGCELAQVFAALGVEVTILHQASEILPNEDEDAARIVRRRLEADGVRIRTNTEARLVARQDPRIRVWAASAGDEREPIDCEALLVAAGRSPNVEGLGLEDAGVAFTNRGVTVDASLRTSQPHIFAAGDAVGPPFYTHLSEAHARIVVRNILVPRPAARVDVAALPRCAFTSPELAQVGLSEREARDRGVLYRAYTIPLAEADRAVLDREDEGFARVLVRKGTDRILGATVVCEQAGELISIFTLAMAHGIGLAAIGRTIFPYPTRSEIARKLADEARRGKLTPIARRVLAWLYARGRKPS